MKQSCKRLLSLALALLMVLSLLPTTVFAASASEAVQAVAYEASTTATFSVGGTTYTDLNAAIDAAKKSGSDKTIVVASDGTLSGSYTIPSGVTLLVPFDDANTLYTTEPGVVESLAGQTAYRTLTLNSGASITVKGAISVGGKLFTSSSSHVCKPTGAYGQIQMNVGSQITVENGGKLYAWGYITGSGNVRITSGATVYECFQVTDWRGGSALMKFITPSNVKKVFPFSQYYVQNIEAPLTIEYGGAEKAYIAAYGEKITIGFVGAGGMFELAEGATFTKTYDPATDRISFDISGNASLKGIKLTVVITINSANYVLPINSNININIHSGTTTISQDVALLPGVQVTIDHGAELNIQTGANLYVYDADEWNKNYVWGSQNGISPVAYSPSGRGNRTISDTSINVNGVLNVAGSVYTTAGGADIYSSDSTGKFVQTAVPGTKKNTYQCTQSGSGIFGTKVTPVEIPITAAKLHNADGTYTETAGSKAGDTYVYANGKWALKGNEITITFDPNGGAGSMEPMSVNPGVGNKLTGNTFTRENYTFTGWNTAANGTGTAYADGDTVNFSADTTLYAQWTQNPVITFNANGGEGIMGTQTVKPNEATALTANTFTRADYDFAGWNTAADGSGAAYGNGATITTSENVTLYAQWTLHKYHVRWLNWDRAVLQEGDYTCEEWAAWDDYNNETPSRPEDENYTYKFLNRWDPYNETKEIDGWGFYPHEDVDFTAVYNKFETLTVTFDANGGTGTMESEKIVNGASGESYTLPKCDFTREGYDFDGWLITGTVGYSTFAKYEFNEEKWDDEMPPLAFSDLTLKASWKCLHAQTEIRNAVEATCTTEGYTGDTWCTVCETKISGGETTPRKNHTVAIDPAVEATCTTTGKTEGSHCSVCNTVIVAQKDIPTIDHSWNEGEITTSPTCENAGVKTFTCTVCNATKTETIDATGHTPVEVAEQPATCTEAGHEAGTKCSKCDAIINGLTTIPALGHDWGEWTQTTAPTCTEKGEDSRYCRREGCDAKETREIAANGHTAVIDPRVEPTIDTEGKTEGSHCSVCNEVLVAQQPIPKKESVTITFVDNDSQETQRVAKGEDVILNANTFTRSESYYKFAGWSTISGGERIYADKAVVNLTEDITLYAVWYLDGWVTDDTGKQYYISNELQKTGWTDIGGATYYLNIENGYAAMNGIYWLPYPEGYGPDAWDMENNGNYSTLGYNANSYFIFDSEGVFQSGINGMYTVAANTNVVGGNADPGAAELLVWAVNGELPWHPGLVNANGDYYYFTTGYFEAGKSYVSDTDYYVSKANNLSWPAVWGEGTFALGKYTFDADGKLQLLDGFVAVGNDTYYYVKGVKTYAGLIEIGGDYYYINSACQVIKGREYNVSKTNGLLPAGKYTFDADGKMVREDPALNGIVKEGDVWYYYVNGVKTYAGLIQIGDDFYYVNSKFEVIHGRNYFISKSNGLLEQKTYTFDADGKLIQPDTILNGIVKDGDTWYYYVDGVKTYDGLIEIDGAYYYVKTNCEVVHGRSYYVSKTNNLMKAGTYTFDKDGKMIVETDQSGEKLNGIVKNGDTWYYYVDGAKNYAGLIKIDDDYYYVRTNGEVVHGQKYFVSKANGLMPNGTYTFDAEGRMILA